jgi:L-ribulose-5-phosphate 3-epimerase
MPGLKIGISLKSLGLPLRRGLNEAQRLGVSGVEVDAVGDLAADQLSQTGRRQFRHLLKTYGLELTAVGCPLRRGLDAAENQEARIEHVKKVLSLSFDLGPRIVVIQAGRVPEEDADPRGGLLGEALLALGQYGDRVGVRLALETGLEPGAALARFLDRFNTGGLAVNYDPANLLMNGFDLYDAARALAGKIVHAHAKDARSASTSRSAQEVPLGHGDIDWLQLLGVLEEIDYHGWLTVERDSGDNRAADVAAGVGFLRRLIG